MLTLANTVNRACQQVAIDAISNAELGMDVLVYAGMGDDKEQAPAVICKVVSASKVNPDLDLWELKASIKVKSIPADTTKEDMGAIATAVFKAFDAPDISTNLQNAVSNLFVGEVVLEDYTPATEEDTAEETINLTIVCAST